MEMNCRTRLKILGMVGLGDVKACNESMRTLGRTFLANAEGRAQRDKIFSSVRNNSPKRYRIVTATLLRFGRCDPALWVNHIYRTASGNVEADVEVFAECDSYGLLN